MKNMILYIIVKTINSLLFPEESYDLKKERARDQKEVQLHEQI